MEFWQILFSVLIVLASISFLIYKLYKKRKINEALQFGRVVTEEEKIRVYLNQINEKFRKRNN
tara:strand:+ start:256 stop:444 length:189 start_codon:yes stop_codon:yes gene_type:complete